MTLVVRQSVQFYLKTVGDWQARLCRTFFSSQKNFQKSCQLCMQFSYVGGAAESPAGPQWAFVGRRMFGPSLYRCAGCQLERCCSRRWRLVSRLDQLIDRPRDFSIAYVTMTRPFVYTTLAYKRRTRCGYAATYVIASQYATSSCKPLLVRVSLY